MFLSVLNSTQEWNSRGDHKLFYPLEVNYVLDMIKSSQQEFKQSDMMKPFYMKARHTLQGLLGEKSHTENLQYVLENYKECNLKNTLKLLMRCKLEFYTRNLLVEIFQEVMRYETHATVLKNIVEKQPSYKVSAQTYQFVKQEGQLLSESSERILFNLKQLRAKIPSHRQAFVFRGRDFVSCIRQETGEIRKMLDIFVVPEEGGDIPKAVLSPSATSKPN